MSTYFNIRVLKSDDRKRSSVVGLVAYTMRTKMHDAVLKRLGHKKHTFDFSPRRDELFASVTLLPPNAPEFWKNNPLIMWTAAAEAEIAHSTGQFRKGAQLAKVGTVHFDRVMCIPLWEQLACLEAFCKQQYVDKGVVVQIDVHPYSSPLHPNKSAADRKKLKDELRQHPNTKVIDVKRMPDEPPCDTEHILRLPDGRQFIYMPHAHLTISTRTVTPEGFSKHKARHLNPSFANGRVTEKDFWTDKWVIHQNEWYSARGQGLRIVKTNLFERRRTGKAYRTEAGRLEADVIRDKTLESLRDPDVLLDTALQHQATFTLKDLQYLLRRAGMKPQEAKHHASEVLKRHDVIELYDVMTSETRQIYTRTDAREQERMTLHLSDAIASRQYKVKEAAIQNAIASRTMNVEQVEAFRRHVGGEGMTLCQGRAGAGKSYMVGAVREVHEASNYRVIGLAPTNAVAADMKKDGFLEASTVHAAVFSAEKGKSKWNEKTLIIVDEAGMLDTEILLKLLRHVAASGAKLVMVGDDRQLASVGRGGMWPLLVDRYKASVMNQINRQEEDWQKAASVALSDGRSGDALRDYNDRGFLHWNDRVDDAMDALLKKYDGDTQADRDAVRFIYASTNEAVNALNAEVHDLHVRRGDVTDVHAFETKRGPITMGIGDRLQFYENKKDAGIINGLMGKVIEASPDEMKVLTDAGNVVSIDPQEYQNFGHGYAGTVYRGQGKTVAHSYCFYDSKFSWSAKSAYVAMTRHKKQVDLFVPRELAPDFNHLVRQISREGRDGASLNWPAESDLKEFEKVVRAKAPKKSDPFKATWSKLWADFVVRAADVIAGLSQPARQSVDVILDKARFKKTPSNVATEIIFDMDEYRQKLNGMAAHKLRDEYAEQKSQHEVTEAPGRIQEIEAKLKAIEVEAARHNLDLANDLRIAQKERAEMQRRKEIIRQAQPKTKSETKS